MLEAKPDTPLQAILKTEEASLNKHLTRKAGLEKKRTLNDASALSTDQPRQRILFTTFISTLPLVFENLYKRLPTAEDGAVEFINVDKLAGRVCRQEGKPPKLDRNAVSKTFEQALKAVFLLDISDGAFPRPRKFNQTEAEYEEQKTLDVSLLFVAITRARDMLFVLCSNNPHDVLIEALDYLEEEAS